jgi:Gpi18-like mannosyltransferase
MLSQCDALWVAPCLMAVTASIERRHAAMLAWAGLAFAIKGQAAFLAPFFLAFLLQRRVPLHLWPIPALVAGLMLLPALLAGWPATDLLFKYVQQGTQLPTFISNAPNPWSILAALAPELGPSLVLPGFLVAAAVSLTLAWSLRTRLLDPIGIVRAALLSALVVPTVLPKMHERYFLLADVLAFVLALACRDRRSIAIAVATSVGSSLAIAAYVLQQPMLSLVSALPTMIALVLVWRSYGSPAAR